MELGNIGEWLTMGGGIMIMAQFTKRFLPFAKFGRVPAGAVWAALWSLVAALLAHDGAWEYTAAFPILANTVTYWLVAHGAYDVFTSKGKQAKDKAGETLFILEQLLGDVVDATDNAWAELGIQELADLDDEEPAA